MTTSDVDARVHHIVMRIDHNWRMGVEFRQVLKMGVSLIRPISLTGACVSLVRE